MTPPLFVILGVTGDLSKRKIIPALYNLLLNKKLERFAVIGVARDNIDVDALFNQVRTHIRNFDKEVWMDLRRRFYYFGADFHDQNKFKELKSMVDSVETRHNLSENRLFYLATMPQHFKVIASSLSKSGLVMQNKRWSRVVFEKPFGKDLKSAREINKCVKTAFSEKQIYRIDHFLGKELVQNISVARFTNIILEPLWNRNYIDHVQIVLSENFGIKGRGGYYDEYGVLKDVVQNHMFQLLCLTAMEAPSRLAAKEIRDEKLNVLKSIQPIKSSDMVLGQYYKYDKEKGVKKNSKTPTFAAVKIFINNARWRGVPFYLISGKEMADKITSIYVQFKESPCLLFKGICDFSPNHLAIQIRPNEGFYLGLNAKTPEKMNIVPVTMDFCHECTFGPNTPEAYENLLYDVVKGDQSAFIRSDEIEEAWKIIDSAGKKRFKLHKYRKRSMPEAAKKLIARDKRSWHLAVHNIGEGVLKK